MAQMPIEVIQITDQYIPDLLQAVNAANSLQSAFVYSILDPNAHADLMLMAFEEIISAELFDWMEAYRQKMRGYHPFVIAAVDSYLESKKYSNLFGSHRAERGLAVISTANVENLIIPEGKMVSYFLYYLARYTLSFVVPDHRNHDATRRCVFDRKIHKPDLLQSMRRRPICDICRRELLADQNGISPEQLSALDRLFAASGRFLDEEETAGDRTAKPRVFIASSVEGLNVAREIQSEIAFDYTVEIWNQGTVFGLGQATIEALEEAVSSYDFGVFVFTPDDELQSKGEFKRVARDNVIFELGLFIGKITRFRAFAIHPSKQVISLPSDLNGMIMATYDPSTPNLRAALGPACQEVRKAINRSLVKADMK